MYSYTFMGVLVLGVVILMAGIMFAREPGQSLQSVTRESLAWGAGFFVSFGVESLVFTHIWS